MLVVPEHFFSLTFNQFQALFMVFFFLESKKRLLKEIRWLNLGWLNPVTEFVYFPILPTLLCSRARSTLLWKYVLQSGHWTFVHSGAPITGSFILDSTWFQKDTKSWGVGLCLWLCSLMSQSIIFVHVVLMFDESKVTIPFCCPWT